MTVLALLGTAVAIAAPPLARLYDRGTVRTQADQFVTLHHLTRSAAVRFGRLAELHIDPAAGAFWIEVDTGTVAGVKDTLGIVRRLGGTGVTVTSDRSVLCFDSRGLPALRGACEGPDAILAFSGQDRVDTVAISPLGKVLR